MGGWAALRDRGSFWAAISHASCHSAGLRSTSWTASQGCPHAVAPTVRSHPVLGHLLSAGAGRGKRRRSSAFQHRPGTIHRRQEPSSEAGAMAQLVECLPSLRRPWGSIPSTTYNEWSCVPVTPALKGQKDKVEVILCYKVSLRPAYVT